MEQQETEKKDELIEQTGEMLPEKRQVLDISPKEVKKQFEAIHQFQILVKRSLHDGHDFGVIQGTDKPTLLKPGAEKIAKLLNCFDDYSLLDVVRNWDKPFFHYEVKCILYEMSSGTKVSSGIGECNSYESKYRYRWVPEWKLTKDQEAMKDTVHSDTRYSKKKKRDFTFYRFENDDIFSQVNTILKMAKKRALVDATLSAGRLSDLFTQDLEEINDRPPKDIEPIEKSTHDQKVEVDKLFQTLVDKFGADPGLIMETLEEKFAIADLNDLTAEQSKKVVTYLKKAIKQKEDKK